MVYYLYNKGKILFLLERFEFHIFISFLFFFFFSFEALPFEGETARCISFVFLKQTEMIISLELLL